MTSTATGASGSSTREQFRAGVEVAASVYLEKPDWAAIVAHVAAQADAVALAPSLVTEEPDLAAALEAAGCTIVIPDEGDPAASVADVAVAIVQGELGVAETGSVLVSEHRLADRVVTMLCKRLVQVVPADRLVDRLEDVADWLAARAGQPGFASLMTGPSRTADIERSLTIGVQGPDEVEVIVLTGTIDEPTEGTA